MITWPLYHAVLSRLFRSSFFAFGMYQWVKL